MIRIFIVMVLLAALFFITVMVIDNHRFIVRRYAVRSDKIRFPVKIIFIADLHEKDYGGDNEKLVNEIADQNPDLILVGGDLIISGQVRRRLSKDTKSGSNGDAAASGTDWMKNSIGLMKKLSRICPVYFVRGNHEIRISSYDEFRDYEALFKKQMEGADVLFIENNRVDPAAGLSGYTDSGIRLQGLELPVEYYKKFKKTVISAEALEVLIGKADPSSFTVLLTHTPVYFEEYVRWGADLCLCGHVHGGLMRLPFIGGVVGTRPNLFPKYSGGQYFYETADEGGNRTGAMILTCGLGMHTLPIRIFNPGEISVIELEPDSGA